MQSQAFSIPILHNIKGDSFQICLVPKTKCGFNSANTYALEENDDMVTESDYTQLILSAFNKIVALYKYTSHQ